MALTTEQRAKVIALRSLGRSYQRIAEEVGVAKDSVIKVCDQECDCVQQYRRELVEEVLESQKLLFRDRLESLGQFAGRLREELEKRVLTPVSTPVIAKMYLDTLKAVQEQAPLIARDKAETTSENIDIEDYQDGSDMGDLKLFRKPTDLLRAVREALRSAPELPSEEK